MAAPRTRAGACAVGLGAMALLAGCAPGQFVDLATVFDEEAADILTDQRDASATACDDSLPCEQALASDQANIFSFEATEAAAAAADDLGGDLVAERYVIQWLDASVPGDDRLFVASLLETAHRTQ